MQKKQPKTLHQTTTALVHPIRVVHTYLCLCNALPARLLLLFLHEQKIEKKNTWLIIIYRLCLLQMIILHQTFKTASCLEFKHFWYCIQGQTWLPVIKAIASPVVRQTVSKVVKHQVNFRSQPHVQHHILGIQKEFPCFLP